MDGQRQSLAPRIQQKQSLVLTNKMKQSLKIASLPILELRDEILQALQENIALEWTGEKSETQFEASLHKTTNKSGSMTGSSYATSMEDFIENIPDSKPTLQDDLKFQIGFVKEDEQVIDLARTIIQNLNTKGFNIVPIKDLIAWSKKEINPSLRTNLAIRAVQIVRFLQPQGCACDSIKDYLLFQLYMQCKNKKLSFQQKSIVHLAARLIAKHLSLLHDVNCTKAKRLLEKDGKTFSLQEVKDAIQLISSLKPYPAFCYGESDNTAYITVDAFIKKEKDKLVIIPNNSALPRIKIAKEIEMIAKEKSEAGKLAKKSVQEAKDLISSIEERESTLLKVIASIIVFQRDFFYYGVKYLCPLRQKDIADELALSPSTISRIVSNKYLACKWGTFPISYFFSNKAVSDKETGFSTIQSNYVASGYSKQACKEIIRNICETNPKISDSKIAELLEKKGITLARRTITKYRNEMGIKVSHKR